MSSSETLSDVLHPEIILDRRGNEFQRELYRKTLHRIWYTEDGWHAALSPDVEKSNILQHLLITKKFTLEKPPVYRLGKDFAEVLAGVKNDIPIDRLPNRFFGYVSLPKNTIFDDTGPILGAYIFIGDAKETSMPPSDYGKRILWMSVLGDENIGLPSHDITISHSIMELKDSFDSTFMALPNNDDDVVGALLGGQIQKIPIEEIDIEKRLEATRCLINAVLYIHSLEPNIDHLKPAGRFSHGDRRKLKAAGKHINLCSLPVIAINWSYRRERTYGIDETWRREHSRWQRCGPGYTQIKLITVKGHPVKYKSGPSAIFQGDGAKKPCLGPSILPLK